ncbi:hypothetical protein Q7P37_006226 [Cladosporium fusiforme]
MQSSSMVVAIGFFIFSGGGIFSSWSVRRTLKDANERHILDIRHYKSSMSQWIVEDPNGKQLCLVKESESKVPKATAMQAQVTAEDVVGGHVTVDIQSSDHAGSITTFHVEGKAIAEMHLVQNNDISFLGQKGLDRSAWKIHVVGGVDMALILALAYCRAYILHAWRR